MKYYTMLIYILIGIVFGILLFPVFIYNRIAERIENERN